MVARLRWAGAHNKPILYHKTVLRCFIGSSCCIALFKPILFQIRLSCGVLGISCCPAVFKLMVTQARLSCGDFEAFLAVLRWFWTVLRRPTVFRQTESRYKQTFMDYVMRRQSTVGGALENVLVTVTVIVFNVSESDCLYVSTNQKVVLESEDMSCSVDHHTSACEYFGRCLYVCSAEAAKSRQNDSVIASCYR